MSNNLESEHLVSLRHSIEKTMGARADQGSYRGGNVNGTLLRGQRGQDVTAGWEITRADRYGRSWRWWATGTGGEPVSVWKVCTRKEMPTVCWSNVGRQLSAHRACVRVACSLRDLTLPSIYKINKDDEKIKEQQNGCKEVFNYMCLMIIL